MSQEPMGQTETMPEGATNPPSDGAVSNPPDTTPSSGSMIPSQSDARTVNNVMRHQYKILTEEEKSLMVHIKDRALALWNVFDGMGSSRELSVAKTKCEEAAMWAVKHLTA